jgi:hypothetical protein
MLGQTFVYHDNLFAINRLYLHLHRADSLENPSESLVESGLRHPAGKTFHAEKEDGFAASGNYVCDQSAARASAGGIDRNSTPTR